MSARTVYIGTTRQLFLDNHVVSRTHQLLRRLHRPIRYRQNPVLRADQPWERGGAGVDITGGTVLYDEEEHIYKMWYRTNNAIFESVPEGGFREATAVAYRSCYAVSEDGLTWVKPPLGQTVFEGSNRNNILRSGRGGRHFIRRPNLIKDYSDADRGKRYKMLYLDEVDGRFALLTAYSADGINWRMNVDPPTFFERPVIPNGILFGWDPRLQEYVHYHRNAEMVPADVDGRMVRNDLRRLVRSRSDDFRSWTQTSTALALDSRDPIDLDIGHLGILSAFLYTDDLYLGFLDTCTVHHAEEVDPDMWESFFKMDHRTHPQELAFSRDGKAWQRLSPGWEFFLAGPKGSWDSNHVIPTKGIVLGDRIWIYYSGSRLSCKSYLPLDPSGALRAPELESESYAIGLAFLRLDGFVSWEGYRDPGWLETEVLVFDGDRLQINARAPREPFSAGRGHRFEFHGDRTLVAATDSPHSNQDPDGASFGALTVEITDPEGDPVPGFHQSDCDVFSGDETSHLVSWKGQSNLATLAGREIRLRFHLRNAALYSFGFVFGGREVSSRRTDLPCPGCRGRPSTGED